MTLKSADDYAHIAQEIVEAAADQPFMDKRDKSDLLTVAGVYATLAVYQQREESRARNIVK